MATYTIGEKAPSDILTLPPQSAVVKSSPQDYYLNANQEWVKFDRATTNLSWLYSHEGNLYSGTGTADDNLTWNGPLNVFSGFAGHPAEPDVHFSGNWVRFKTGWLYEIETHLLRVDSSSTSIGFGLFSGGSYGASGDPLGMGGSAPGVDGGSRSALHNNMPSRALVVGNSDWWRICNTATGVPANITGGSAYYGKSHSIIRCLGRSG